MDAETKTKVALFDVDGTLIEGTLPWYFAEILRKNGSFPEVYEAQLEGIEHQYREGKISYEEYALQYLTLWARAIKGRPFTLLQEVAQKIEYEKYFFPFAKKLTETLRKRGYHIIIISGSFPDMVKPIARKIGAIEVYATPLHVSDGNFTGTIGTHVGLQKTKREITSELGLRYGFDKMAAFGDTIADIGMLELVRYPVAVRPKRELYQEALHRKWPIIETEEDAQKVLERLP